MQMHRSLRLALVLLGLASASPAQSPQPTQGKSPSSERYKPPPLSMAATTNDPSMQKLVMHLYTGDMSGFKADLQKQAEAGNPAAQLMLGNQYIPKEKFALGSPPTKNGIPHPKLIPDNDPSPLAKFFPPSYTEALKWLTLASAQGSGEASELVAQIITRMHNEQLPSNLTIADATRYRALAVRQGYDLEEVDVRCYRLIRSEIPLTCNSKLSIICPSESEMKHLRDAGLKGNLVARGGASGSFTTASMHPGGAPGRALIVLDHDINIEQRLPLPRHASAIYIQQSNEWVTLPKDVPVLPRNIFLTPGSDPQNAIIASIQNIDGSRSGGYCVDFIDSVPR